MPKKSWVSVLTVIVVFMVGYLYLIKKASFPNQPTQTPQAPQTSAPTSGSKAQWPQSGYDAQNTGQAPVRGPQTNKLKWRFNIGRTILGYQTGVTYVVLDKNGNLYFGTSEGSLISLDPQMKKRWEYRLPDAYSRNKVDPQPNDNINVAGGISDFNIAYSPALGKSNLFFGTSGINNSHKIYALDLNGHVQWTYPIDGPLESSIKLGTNFRIYFTTATTLYSLTEEGKDVRTYPVVVRNNTPALAKDNSVYICSQEGLISLAADFKFKWVFSQTKNLRNCMPTVDPKTGTVYFPHNSQDIDKNKSKIYALNPNGSLKWMADIFWAESAPVIASDGTIYIGTTDLSIDLTLKTNQPRGNGELFAINPNGIKKWSYNVKSVLVCKKGQDQDCPDSDKWSSGTSIDASPTLGADGTIYFGTDAQTYFALNPNGTVKWTYQASDEWDNRAAIAKDGTLYVGPRGLLHGGLYAFNDAATFLNTQSLEELERIERERLDQGK